MSMISDLPPGRRPRATPTGAQGRVPVVFGLSLDLLLLSLLPLWLFLASLLPVLAAVWLGVLEERMFYPAMMLTGFVCHTVLLPLAVYRAHLASKRRREAADEIMWRFASRITALYAATRRSPQVSADPRAAEAFRLYLLAEEEFQSNPHRPCEVRTKISRGKALADRALSESPTARSAHEKGRGQTPPIPEN